MNPKKLPTEISLMEAVLESGWAGTHREALIRRASMSKTSFYRVVRPLLEKGILLEQGGYYHFPLNHPHNYAFKLWRDQDRLLQISDPLRSELVALVGTLVEKFATNLLALWLVGSAAHLTLGAESDLDLVVVLRKPQECEPKGSRLIQLTSFTEKEFRELYRRGDSFVRTTLQYGLILKDRDFAQEFYVQAMPLPTVQALREREEMLQQGERRLSLFLREDALDEARQLLSSIAVAIGRSMLERLGQLPAGKHDLVLWAELFFGPLFSELLEKCLSKKAADRMEITQLNRQLQRWHEKFASHSAYLESLVRSLTSSGREFEVSVSKMLEVVFPEGLTLPVESKSCIGEFGVEQLLELSLTDSILVLNSLREVPPTQRPDLSSEICEGGGRAGVIVWDSRRLLQYHNRILLEEHRPTWSSSVLQDHKASA